MLKWIIPVIISVTFFGIIVIANYPQPSYDGKLCYDSLCIEPTDLGAVRIWEDEILVGASGFALTGEVLEEDYLTNSWDWEWYWWTTNRTIEMEDDWGNGTIDYWNFTEITLHGYNLNLNFNITQTFQTVFNNGFKHKITITNNLVEVTDYKMWLLNYIEPTSKFTYNDVEYKGYQLSGTYLSGNFDDILSLVDFGETYVYEYVDLINSGFNITDIHIGTAERFGSPENMYMGIGVSLGDNIFNKGQTIVYDPNFVTDYTSPGGAVSGDWTSPSNVLASDDSKATSSSLNDILLAYDFGFDLPNGTIIHGIEVNAEGNVLCPDSCPARPNAQLSARLTWDGGGNWTVWENAAPYFSGLSDGFRTMPISNPLIYNWSHDWVINDVANELNNTNFRVQINFSSQVGLTWFDGSGKGLDHIKLRINYTSPNPIINWTDTMIANGSIIGSILKANATSTNNAPIPDCKIFIYNYTTGVLLNSTVFEPINNDLDCYIDYYVEPFGRFSTRMGAMDGSNPLNVTEYRWYTSNNTQPPSMSFIYPPNNSVIGGITEINLNFSIFDPESDFTNAWLRVSNNISRLIDSYYYFDRKENGNYSQNIDFIPECPLDDLSEFVSIYAMDNLLTLGENDTHIFDYTNRFNGTAQNITFTMDGRYGGGFEFGGEGSDSAIMIDDGSGLNSFFADGSGGCVSAWVYKTDSSSSRIIAKGADTTGCFYLRIGAGDDFEFGVLGDCTFGTQCLSRDTSTSFSNNHWIHVMGCYNATDNKIRKYLGGNQVGVAEDCSGDFSAINVTLWEDENQETLVGAVGTLSNPSAEWNGTIDHVRIWNESSVDIESLFKLDKGIYYWNLTGVETYKPEFNSTNGTSEFKLGCDIDCVLNKIYDALFYCGSEDMTFVGTDRTTDSVTLNTNITNYTRWEMEQCTVIGMENFKG